MRGSRRHAATVAAHQALRITGASIAAAIGAEPARISANVSRIENSEDVLLSTLTAYLHATGATDVAITMSVGGERVELDLERLTRPPA